MSEYAKCHFEIYVDAIDILENRIVDDDKYPVVEDVKVKTVVRLLWSLLNFL